MRRVELYAGWFRLLTVVDRNLSAEDVNVAAELGIPVADVHSLCRQNDTTFAAVRIGARLTEGEKLLRQGKQVLEVANHVGYQRANAFIRQFKRKHGVTPAVWRDKVLAT